MEQELQTAKNMAYKYGAKIVRGAYMDAERQLATQKGYEDPIHPTKEDTTNSYYSVMKMALEAVTEGYAHFKIGTHNPNSVREALKCMEELGIAADSGRVSFAQLYGMGNHITYPLGEAGYHVYKVIPYGPVMKVIPYLLRRAKENSSGMGNADEERELLNQELRHRLCLKS
jgi:proline dehydrogenase